MGYLSRWPIFFCEILSRIIFLSISIRFLCAVEVAYKRVVSNFTLLHKLGFNLIEKRDVWLIKTSIVKILLN